MTTITPLTPAQLQLVQDVVYKGVMPSWNHSTPSDHPETTLYLVTAEVAGIPFFKIGLTYHCDPLKRDNRAYRKALRAIRIPASRAGWIESLAIGIVQTQCEDATSPRPPLTWSGTDEAVCTNDQEAVLRTFDGVIDKYSKLDTDVHPAAANDAWKQEFPFSHIVKSAVEISEEMLIQEVERFGGSLEKLHQLRKRYGLVSLRSRQILRARRKYFYCKRQIQQIEESLQFEKDQRQRQFNQLCLDGARKELAAAVALVTEMG